MTTREFLTKIPMFENLSAEDLNLLTLLWHERTIRKSEVLFRKGDVGSSMFIVEDGAIEICVLSAQDEEDIRVSTINKGGFFGELALISGQPRTATAKAIDDCRLLEMWREEFINFLSTRPIVAISMINEIGKRLQATNELVTSMAARNINEEMDEQMSFGDRLADRVADFVGSWKFVIYFLVGIGIWCVLNLVELLFMPFDPYPFVFLNLILALVASLQAPLIMMSQNRAQIKDRLRAEQDYEVNLKSELMLQQLHEKIDQMQSAPSRKKGGPQKKKQPVR
jgi:CRP/FNR family transcriptional regulator, cyclic AMP receptor protein